MKYIFLLLAVSGIRVTAETIILPVGSNTVFTIPQGETLLITAYRSDPGVPLPKTWLVSSGVTNFWRICGCMDALPGPLELIFSGSTYHFLRIKRMRTTNIQARILRPREPQEIMVASNRTIWFFNPSPNDGAIGEVIFTKGGQSVRYDNVRQGTEFDGPLTINLHGPDAAEGVVVVPFIINEEFASLPQQNAVSVPPGQHSFTIEKSSNLTKWTPLFQQMVTQDEKAFYRFRIDP